MFRRIQTTTFLSSSSGQFRLWSALLLVVWCCSHCGTSFVVKPSMQRLLTTTTTTRRHGGLEQTVILDGAEWQSVKRRLSHPHPSDYGIFTVVITNYRSKRVCAVKDTTTTKETATTLVSDDQIPLLANSVATVPASLSDQEALWTMIQSLPLCCALPVTHIGGDSQGTTWPHSKIVVLGGNPTATKASRALMALQCDVTVVCQSKLSNTGAKQLRPEDDFATRLGAFDAVLDVLGDETGNSITLNLLQSLHGCHSYISLHPQSQSLIEKHGLIWGPGKVKDYMLKLQKTAVSATNGYIQTCPDGFGEMVERLLEANVVWEPQTCDSSLYVRNWSLQDFWEFTKWPRNVESSTRFGLPVQEAVEEEEEEEESMVSAPPMPGGDIEQYMTQDPVEESSPHITWLTGVAGLHDEIVDSKSSAVLFLSAPYCRTCRYLKPKYQRMAKQYSEVHPDVSFCKADASGLVGKQLGKTLGVNFVPSFVLFRNGERYGKPLAVSKLPSKKLDMAIDYLRDGKPWDESVFAEEDDGRMTKKRKMW